MRLLLLLTAALLMSNLAQTQDLVVIDQDYNKAKNIAAHQGKLIFVDFYTTWYQPCKKLDKLIFNNDSMRQELGKDFVLLKYNAENDTIYHLSKKHHVFSYPTGLILTANGRVLTKIFGFRGESFTSIAQSVAAFTQEAVELNNKNETFSGYAEEIDVSQYPRFYIDYVNRTNTKIDSAAFAEYWKLRHDVFSEAYFSTLFYFSSDDIPDAVADIFVEHKQKYSRLFGEKNVDVALMFITFRKFESALSTKNQAEFDYAKEYAKMALDEDFAEQTISRYEAEFDGSSN